jgi:hypothetical protein
MQSFGFKLFHDAGLQYPVSQGTATITLSQVDTGNSVKTFYFGAIDDYDNQNNSYIRKKITYSSNDTLLWQVMKYVDDGAGGQVLVHANEFVKSVSVTAPDEQNVVELTPDAPVANFYYKSDSNKKLSTTTDSVLWCNYGVGEYKFGWSTSTNESAGGFRLAKRDDNDTANEIIMTREFVYGSSDAHKDRFMLYSNGDAIPAGWYVKDFWAYTYPNADDDETQENDVIAKLNSLESGVANALRYDVEFYLPPGYEGGTEDIVFIFGALGTARATKTTYRI